MAEEDASAGPELGGAERFHLLVDAVEEYAIFMLDPSGDVASWNSGAARIKGYRADEILGRNFSVFYPAADVAAGKPARELTAATEHGHFRDEGWRVRKDGTMFWANVVITAIHDAHGLLAGFAKVTRDDTDRKAAELAAKDAIFDALEANASKDRFLSRMSHELRTPLNAILGFGQLLQMDDLAPASRDSVDHIVGAGGHLLALVDDVLDIARMESGEIRLSLEPVRVVDVAEEVVGMLEPLADRHHVPIIVGDIGRDIHVRADRQRLTQVLLNLLSNAIKFSRDDAGGVRLEASVDPDARLRVTVADNGVGIAPEDLGRLFQPFERLAAEQAEVEGTGLGLAVSKSLMVAMGGEIGVDSESNRGSTFWITLPSTDPDDGALPVSLTVQPAAGTHPTAAKTVLYIEDNLSNVRLLERVLGQRPTVTLIVATLGSAGIDAALQHLPDLILLDLHLPDMTGADVLERLRNEPATVATPIVIVTADATPGTAKRLRNLGATDVLTKPFNIQHLLHLVDGSVAGSADAEHRPPAADHDRAPAVDSYITGFVHDVNNSLGVILNYATMLSHMIDDAVAKADLLAISQAADTATKHVRTLLENARQHAREVDRSITRQW